jgi:hypothetical protein
MENSQLVQFFEWSAYLSAIATVSTFVTGILFFTVGKPFGKINDISSVFQVLFMIPLSIMFVMVTPDNDQILGLIAALGGILGMILSGVGQSLLVIGRIDFDSSRKFFPAGAAIGIWLITVCSISIHNGSLPHLWAWIGILAGLGYVVTVIGFLKGGEQEVLFTIGALVLGISYPIWAIWLGRLVLSGALRIGAG